MFIVLISKKLGKKRKKITPIYHLEIKLLILWCIFFPFFFHVYTHIQTLVLYYVTFRCCFLYLILYHKYFLMSLKSPQKCSSFTILPNVFRNRPNLLKTDGSNFPLLQIIQ